jgi:hypothetical protein
VDCARSNLLKVDWQVNGLAAEFAYPDDDALAVRVSFNRPTIVRILDEMPLSTENELADVKGLVPHHFAYRVEGAIFAETQSEVWKEVFGPVHHYQFITGWGCMDVVSAGEPTFEVVKVAA